MSGPLGLFLVHSQVRWMLLAEDCPLEATAIFKMTTTTSVTKSHRTPGSLSVKTTALGLGLGHLAAAFAYS